jgi:hypothetical protein
MWTALPQAEEGLAMLTNEMQANNVTWTVDMYVSDESAIIFPLCGLLSYF